MPTYVESHTTGWHVVREQIDDGPSIAYATYCGLTLRAPRHVWTGAFEGPVCQHCRDLIPPPEQEAP